ncbi:MAG: hypothetical protein HZA63_07895 [Rhodocyclales bacterium]|nr:hypothetical protein [Rhodocyclales bacterium]
MIMGQKEHDPILAVQATFTTDRRSVADNWLEIQSRHSTAEKEKARQSRAFSDARKYQFLV